MGAAGAEEGIAADQDEGYGGDRPSQEGVEGCVEASTPSGRLFIESLTFEKPEPTSPHRRILNDGQAGVVLTTFGLAMM